VDRSADPSFNIPNQNTKPKLDRGAIHYSEPRLSWIAERSTTLLREDLGEHFAGDVGQAITASVVEEGQALVIDPEQMQQRGV
jgi:hypothetical protein